MSALPSGSRDNLLYSLLSSQLSTAICPWRQAHHARTLTLAHKNVSHSFFRRVSNALKRTTRGHAISPLSVVRGRALSSPLLRPFPIISSTSSSLPQWLLLKRVHSACHSLNLPNAFTFPYSLLSCTNLMGYGILC